MARKLINNWSEDGPDLDDGWRLMRPEIPLPLNHLVVRLRPTRSGSDWVANFEGLDEVCLREARGGTKADVEGEVFDLQREERRFLLRPGGTTFLLFSADVNLAITSRSWSFGYG